MAFRDREDRQMFQGDWQCAKCGGAITELPFSPDPSRLGQLKCSNCHREERASFGGNRNFNRGGSRQMFQGDWQCAKCGGAITELPFSPDPMRLGQLKCSSCHREERGDRGGFRG